jgi:L-fuculose-phosphate aldolase
LKIIQSKSKGGYLVQSEYKLKQEIVEVGKRIYQNGYVASNDGNISVRIGNNEVLTTPTGVSKGFMTPEMIVKVNLNGEIISGNLKPSSEIKMHLDIYNRRPDVKAVVHAHPPTATGFAVAGIPLDKFVLPEIIISLGTIPIAKYGTPSTDEIPVAIREYLESHDAFLLENHGALTVGTDLFNAYYKMESLELFAKISLTARQLGKEQELSKQQVGKLIELRQNMGIQGRHPGCLECGKCTCQEKAPSTLPQTNGQFEMTEDQLKEFVGQIAKKVIAKLG